MDTFTRSKLTVVVALTLAGFLLVASTGAVLAFTQSSQVQFTLEGCRNDGSIVLPILGKFVCPDSAYTTGNLGKGWNELDLVPHRLTTQVGNQSGATPAYDVIIAADYQTGGKTGYDVISAPVINAAKSDASCQITNVGPQLAQSNATGGVDLVIYRVISLQQNQGATCVLDYYQRLALGAHLYPGSSLQSYMFESEDFQTGKRTLSIPVTEILPQELSKDMTATQGTDHIWDITKVATPATLAFANTCDGSAARSAQVSITIQWAKLAATPSGPITIVTHVYAKNPAARTITVNVSDQIRSGTTVLDTATSGSVDVPANTNQLVLTHTTTVPSGSTNLNDVATATYTDKVTGVPVPGITTATASAPVQFSGSEKNQNATIKDIESIVGAGLQFSVDSLTGASGSFDGGYVLGTRTTGPVSWTSAVQSGNGSVTFSKTVYVGAGTSASGALADTATLTGSEGFTKSASASVNISADARVSLTINKSVSPALTSGSETFTFHVKNSAGQEVAAPTITFSAGETFKSVAVSNLAAGTYTISEEPVVGWIVDSQKSVTITLPNCAGAVNMANSQLGNLQVTKTVDWKGIAPDSNQTFEICITGPSYPLKDCQTVGSNGGVVAWSNIIPGAYAVSETNAGTQWTSNITGSSATVVSGGTATASVSNVRRLGSLVVTKTVNWNGVAPDRSQTFQICITGPSYPSGDCKTFGYNGGPQVWANLIPGQYTVSETNAGTQWTTSITGSPAAVPADGGQAAATVTNTRKLGSLVVTKTVNWNGVSPVSTQTFQICIQGPAYPTTPNCKTIGYTGGALTWNDLIPGSYSVTEPGTGTEWSVTTTGSPAAVPTDGGQATASVTNTRKLASLQVTKNVNWNGTTPDPSASFQVCIQGPSYATPNCKTFNATNGWTQIWTGLIPGSYTVSETDPGSTWTVNLTGSPATVPADGGQASASVTNTRKLGSLQVTKTVDWKGISPDTSQTFQICVAGPSYPGGSCKTFSYNGGTQTWDNLMPGNYTVSETGLSNQWTAPVIAGSPATVVSGSTATASVANTRKLGSLQVTKTVNWNGVAQDTTQAFQICITGPSYLSGDCKTFGYNGGTQVWSNLIPGTYTVSETSAGTQWTTSITGSTAAVPADGGQAAATVTNTRKLGSLVVTKTVNWNGVTPDQSKTFQICITGPSYPTTPNCKSIGYNGGPLTWLALIPGAYTVGETNAGIGWTVNVTGSPANVPTDGGQAMASVSNTFIPGFAKVVKTVSGAPPTGTQSFTFQLRQGATTTANGTILESANADSTNGGVINFATKLIPGATYQLCEIVMPGWTTTLGTFVPGSFNPPDGVAPNPNVDNSILCVNFTVNAGETKSFTINNMPPPGGRALTIGFWKNWASCANSNGKQKPVLDQTLAKAEPTGIPIGILTLHGSVATPDKSPDCLKAVRLLNKSTVDTGKKMSSDPAFNLAAQYLAAQLNFSAGAGRCSAAVNAVNQAQALLTAIKFDGIKYSKMSAAQITQANTLATTLDNYNNDRLCQ